MNYVTDNCYVKRQGVSDGAPHAEVSMNELAQIFERQSAKAIKFLLERVDSNTRLEFIKLFAKPERQAQLATAKIIVRQTMKGTRRTGNTGQFQIFVQTDNGDLKLVHFTNQISTVYYLLYLIDRRQKQGQLPPLCLTENKKRFVELYHMTYDNITHEEVLRRYNGLLFRKEGEMLRAGRKNEVIYDIRRHLNALFNSFSENYQPYAMTANNHLAISSDRILFEDGAEELLQLKCG